LAKLRISIVEYLNTAPLVWSFTRGPLRGRYELFFTVPSQCAEALRAGAVDIAILPVIEYQHIPDLVVLPDLAIASKRSARSLLMLGKKPMKQAARIALDRSSRSTQMLARILCAEHWNISPEFFEAAPDPSTMLRDADAALLIGDTALRLAMVIEKTSTRSADGAWVSSGASAELADVDVLYVYDIVEAWRNLSGWPAVLAVWAARRETVTSQVVEDFLASRNMGLAQVREIAGEAAKQLRLPAEELLRYLSENIDYSLDEENRRGLEAYFERAARLRLIPRVKAIEWAKGRDLSAATALRSGR